LLLDETNPRSLVYQIDRLQNHIKTLPMPNERLLYRLNEEERLILEASTRLRLADPAALAQVEPNFADRKELENLLTDIYTLLSQTFYAVSHTFFSHAQPLHQLISSVREF
ncbi:MAG TPA: alpha-E domain-containing protein, partial [Thermodesulfovibrionia bacterium]|nr:alpha-E domain-containing protein [Thermodesulfovibrionia bacterium]